MVETFQHFMTFYVAFILYCIVRNPALWL